MKCSLGLVITNMEKAIDTATIISKVTFFATRFHDNFGIPEIHAGIRKIIDVMRPKRNKDKYLIMVTPI